MKNAIMASALLLLLPLVAFADIGPGPSDWPRIVINATYNGMPVPDSTQIRVVCYHSGSISQVPTSSLQCQSGVCSNSGFYKLSPCVEGGDVAFEFSSASFPRNYTTTKVHIEKGMVASFDVRLNADGSSNTAPSKSEPLPPSPPSPCPLAVLGLVALAGFALSR